MYLLRLLRGSLSYRRHHTRARIRNCKLQRQQPGVPQRADAGSRAGTYGSQCGVQSRRSRSRRTFVTCTRELTFNRFSNRQVAPVRRGPAFVYVSPVVGCGSFVAGRFDWRFLLSKKFRKNGRYRPVVGHNERQSVGRNPAPVRRRRVHQVPLLARASVETAEALAEYLHKKKREELGIAGEDSPHIRDLFHQKYRGSRYSFGYPACPNLEDQAKLFALLHPEENVGV